MRTFDIRHDVTFEETNAVGNVYFTNHLKWQGRAREEFLRRHAPDVMEKLAEGLVLATVRCGCEYLSELFAFDRVIIRMRLEQVVQNRIQLAFEYFRENPGGNEQLVARGSQEVACMTREGSQTVPAPIPPSLLRALEPYRASPAAAAMA